MASLRSSKVLEKHAPHAFDTNMCFENYVSRHRYCVERNHGILPCIIRRSISAFIKSSCMTRVANDENMLLAKRARVARCNTAQKRAAGVPIVLVTVTSFG